MIKCLKKTTVAVALVIGLAGCAERTSTAERLTLAANAGTALAETTTVLLRQDIIDVKEACVVEQYSRMAKRNVADAYVAFVKRDPDTANEYLDSAFLILDGFSDEANRLAEDACAGNRESN